MSDVIGRREEEVLDLSVLLPFLMASGAQGSGGSQGSGGGQGASLDPTALLLISALSPNWDREEFLKFFLVILATQGFGTQSYGTQGNILTPALFLLASGSRRRGSPRISHEIKELIQQQQGTEMRTRLDQLVEALTGLVDRINPVP